MKLFKKVLLIAVAVLTCASLLSFAAFATGEEGADSAVSSDIVEETSSAVTESVSSEETNTEENVSSDTQEEDTTSSEEEITSSEETEDTNSAADSGVGEDQESTEDTTGEDTETEDAETEDTESEIRLEPDDPYNATVSEDWSDSDVTVNVSSDTKTETPKKDTSVHKDIFDLRSVAIKAMIITVLVALLCICGLVFINIKYRNSVKAEGEEPKKKLKATKRAPRKPRA